MTGILGFLIASGSNVNANVDVTVTVGVSGSTIAGYWNLTGSPVGSISPSTCSITGGNTILELNYNSSSSTLYFTISGVITPPGVLWWNNMSIAGTNFTRAAASYAYNPINGRTGWTWTGIATNPFGTTVGATKVVSWSY